LLWLLLLLLLLRLRLRLRLRLPFLRYSRWFSLNMGYL
jgi:hypothetical protein